jgi:hypothetical protein
MEAEADNPAERFLHTEFPPELHPLIPSALRRAYAAADEMIDRHPQLCTPGGRYQRGDLVALAADYEFELLVKANSLPFEPSWEYYARPTGKHFVMRSRRAHITISQLDDPEFKPRNAVFRNLFAIPNGRYLFQYMNEEVERDNARRLMHVLHGYQNLTFAHLTLPHPQENRHVWKTSNLMNIPHVVTSDLPRAEGPTVSPEPQTIENLERHLRDSDD